MRFDPRWYKLDGHQVVPARSVLDWARWLEEAGEARRVGFTELRRFSVSTVFLGLDHNFSESGPPLLFETMVFENEPTWDAILQRHIHEEAEQWPMSRYSTWAEAEAGHKEHVALIERVTPRLVVSNG